MWNDVSEFLVSCRYKEPKYVNTPSEHELSIFLLNIQILTNKTTKLRENIQFYQKFDFLLFQETNGISDILLNGFHVPSVQKPIRSTGKRRGLAIYVNENACDF